ncbi:hypothetical protein [Nitrosovibrio sp. Nv17]|jgi:hypothetical protein|uniref:hypothetical protein n=1 Tax=Nitrosovibrio sp. Nv17 TaxID=1855339 RepID=UPI000908A77A|nr:hypothetical protein [Nitrosovibrio sp. Nv17]SFW18075.1 hypothetical protein SAMN05216414_10499 [Nitrosovibrio sp. Nv17]
MSAPSSLEEEKTALLARMQARRDAYRARFVRAEASRHAPSAFPRSHTFRFLARHPYSLTLGLAAVIVLAPRPSLRAATRGGARLTSGLLSGPVRALLARQLLPSMIRLLRARGRY